MGRKCTRLRRSGDGKTFFDELDWTYSVVRCWIVLDGSTMLGYVRFHHDAKVGDVKDNISEVLLCESRHFCEDV